ncbi:MAG: hypothetical protein QW407_01570 [Thermofilaceae archaeon]
MAEEDFLLRKMMLDMKRKLMTRQPSQKEEKVDYVKLFYDNLSEDGKEMFNRALMQYPSLAQKVAEMLGQLLVQGKISGPLDAETIYGIFSELGYPIRLETKIVYKKKGKVKTISELLKEEE